ncbi:MAG: hypothetical protein ACR2IP_01045 [Solirubrobacteraceae bacterium]
MARQRVHTRRVALADALLRAVAVLLAAALIWYGAMTVLLALKVSPHDINGISAYGTIYADLVSIAPRDITSGVRAVVAAAGVACFLVCASIAWRALPRPYLARGELELPTGGERGSTIVTARVIERAAEVAALAHPLVTDAAGRYGTENLAMALTIRSPGELADTLGAVQQHVISSLQQHQLPQLPINVTLTGVDRPNRRELA